MSFSISASQHGILCYKWLRLVLRFVFAAMIGIAVMLYTSLLFVIDLMFDDVWIYDVNFDEFGERVIFRWLDCGKCSIFVGEMGFVGVFYFEWFVLIFRRFWSSSIEALFFKGWEVFWRCFWWFLTMLKWRKHWFFKVLSNSVSNSKWGLRRGKNRYAVPGNRTLVLKCKHTPHPYRTNVLKYIIIVQYYSMFLTVKW